MSDNLLARQLCGFVFAKIVVNFQWFLFPANLKTFKTGKKENALRPLLFFENRTDNVW